MTPLPIVGDITKVEAGTGTGIRQRTRRSVAAATPSPTALEKPWQEEEEVDLSFPFIAEINDT